MSEKEIKIIKEYFEIKDENINIENKVIKIFDAKTQYNYDIKHFKFSLNMGGDNKSLHQILDEYIFRFEKCTFECKFRITTGGRDRISLKEFHFQNCDFKESTCFENLQFDSLTFKDCEFHNDAHFYDLCSKDNSSKTAENTNDKAKLDFLNCVFSVATFFYDIPSGLRFQVSIRLKKATFEGDISFKNIEFANEVDFTGTEFKGEVDFRGAKFKGRVDFTDAKFNGETRFDECIFNESVNFSNINFNNNIYFNDSIFNNYAEFYASIFEKDASFYGVTFKKVPNFSSCYFKEPRATNLVNIDIGALSFESVKAKYARNLKDSFRIIKDVLLVKNNTLDAQEWHKLELYAQEKEIEFQREQNKNSAESENKNTINLWVNQHLLFLYRITSLHHTDFTRIFNFMVLMIVVYGLFLLLMGILLERPNTLYVFSIVPSCIYVALTLLLYCLMVFFSVYAYPCICKIPKLFYITLILIAIVIIVKPQLINPFVGIFSADKLYESKLEKFLNDESTNTIVKLAENLKNNPNPTQSITKCSTPSNQNTIAEINAARVFILENKEKIKQLSKDSLPTLQCDKNLILKAFYQDEIMRNILKSTNILYSLILLLCLFSLQKTARKNSIILS